MLEEYKVIAQAYFDLAKRKSDMFRLYLILISIPITLITAVLKLENVSNTNNPIVYPSIIGYVFVIISLCGIMMTGIIFDLRFESLLYAKTINLIRRFFNSIGSSSLEPFLVLPISDEKPYFNEAPWKKGELNLSATFLEVLFMSLFNSLYLSLGLQIMLPSVFLGIKTKHFILILFFILITFHIIFYNYSASKKDKKYTTKYSDSYQQ